MASIFNGYFKHKNQIAGIINITKLINIFLSFLLNQININDKTNEINTNSGILKSSVLNC